MSSVLSMDRSRVVWWVLGFVLAAVLGLVIYSFVGTFVFGLFIYYATRPVYRRLRRRIRPPSLAAAVALFTLALPALLLLAYTLAIGLQEFNAFATGRDFGQFETLLKPYIDVSTIAEDPQSLLNDPNGVNVVQDIFDQSLNYVGFVGNAALHLFIMIGIAFYLLRDDERLGVWFRRRFADDDGVVETYARQVDHDFSNIFFGNILNAALTGIIGAISYNALAMVAPPSLAIPYPTLLGLLTGIASLVPVIGMKLIYVPVGAYLSVLSVNTSPRLLWFPTLFVTVSFLIVDVIPDLVLRPYVSGRGLHLGMVMFAYIFGPLLFGWYGIFLGPMLLVLLVHFVRLILPELVAGRPIEPQELGEVIGVEVDLAGGAPENVEDAEGSDEGDVQDGTDAPA